ncbi:NAD(P)-dependent oxidoreductase [Roseococcus suduntuyensis]|uniref:2-hydroxy-3-oxopropionate reductase n=1 Tax=Roseococcus suduntuyensis TaxID=455361 RepID=A0A840AG45_9PROT|nr:NAD(P)-dependent oxidoreductase [Roseococcus suduntuyensis]MBB3900007.1 2-hydroxy-3-oxopropionate reductase [Roseococcus suduntuyensis]
MPDIPPPARVAFVGLGIMGAAMAANLRRAGFDLAIHSRSRGKAAELEAMGAHWCDTGAEAAREAGIIGLCVPDTPDVELALFGPGGIAEGAGAGSVVIDFSTISAQATQGFAARLAEQGVTLLDSPVSGGPQGAIDGTLTCMVGGDAAGFAQAASYFAAVGKTITHLGPSGAGQICKSANQLIICATLTAVSEALAMGRKAGLDPETMRTALSGGSADSFVLRNHAKRIIAGNYTPGFRAELMRKDMRLAAAAIRDHDVFGPATAMAAPLLELLVNQGAGKDDLAALGRLVAELSGLEG